MILNFWHLKFSPLLRATMFEPIRWYLFNEYLFSQFATSHSFICWRLYFLAITFCGCFVMYPPSGIISETQRLLSYWLKVFDSIESGLNSLEKSLLSYIVNIVNVRFTSNNVLWMFYNFSFLLFNSWCKLIFFYYTCKPTLNKKIK